MANKPTGYVTTLSEDELEKLLTFARDIEAQRAELARGEREEEDAEQRFEANRQSRMEQLGKLDEELRKVETEIKNGKARVDALRGEVVELERRAGVAAQREAESEGRLAELRARLAASLGAA